MYLPLAPIVPSMHTWLIACVTTFNTVIRTREALAVVNPVQQGLLCQHTYLEGMLCVHVEATQQIMPFQEEWWC